MPVGACAPNDYLFQTALSQSQYLHHQWRCFVLTLCTHTQSDSQPFLSGNLRDSLIRRKKMVSMFFYFAFKRLNKAQIEIYRLTSESREVLHFFFSLSLARMQTNKKLFWERKGFHSLSLSFNVKLICFSGKSSCENDFHDESRFG